MASSEDRIKQMFQDDMGQPAKTNVSLSESGVSSLDAVAFVKKVGDEYNITISPEDMAGFNSIGDLIAHGKRVAKAGTRSPFNSPPSGAGVGGGRVIVRPDVMAMRPARATLAGGTPEGKGQSRYWAGVNSLATRFTRDRASKKRGRVATS